MVKSVEASELHRLHDNMVAADIVFGKAVLKQHGKKLYNLRRYQPVFDNDETELARQEYRTATDAWRKAYKRATE
jgi:hypothetical protein